MRHLYLSEDGRYVLVRGAKLTAEQAGIVLPEGEALVEIPIARFIDAVRGLRAATTYPEKMDAHVAADRLQAGDDSDVHPDAGSLWIRNQP